MRYDKDAIPNYVRGFTMREVIAILVMARTARTPSNPDALKFRAEMAVKHADALLLALEVNNENR